MTLELSPSEKIAKILAATQEIAGQHGIEATLLIDTLVVPLPADLAEAFWMQPLSDDRDCYGTDLTAILDAREDAFYTKKEIRQERYFRMMRRRYPDWGNSQVYS